MESQICCSNKLLLEMGLKLIAVPPERQGLAPLATWYADLFYFNRRKCLVFYNPATGYGMVVAYVSKRRLANLHQELLRTYQNALEDDGISSKRSNELLAAVANPTACRTSDRKSRARVVSAIRDAEFAMGRSVMSDPVALERDAHVMIAHGVGGPTGDPVMAFGQFAGEPVKRRLPYGPWHRDLCQVLVTLEDIEPPIWRRILIPSGFRLDESHLVIQGAIGWTNSHLHVFRAGGKAFEAIYDRYDEYEGLDETQIGFYDFLQLGGGTAEYVYDYGDHWRHTIHLEARFLSDLPGPPSCVEGARACPPEDVGGTRGYDQMLKAIADPTDEEYGSYMEWLPENYSPEVFSVESANKWIRDMLTYRD